MKYCQLTEAERYTLSVLKREGRSLRAIAHALQRSPSTISREVRRNATIDHNRPRPLYVPSKAHEHANGRRRRSRRVKHHAAEVYAHVEELLGEEQWSPEQIASQLDEQLGVRLSHMTIYRHVRRNQRQGGRLYMHLRQGGKRRRKRTHGPEKRGKLANKPMIDTRPQAVEAREEVGHWEGDTVMGAAGERACLLTLVERSTGYAVVAWLPHRTVLAVNRAAVRAIGNSGLPFKTITWDNGTEFHGYRELEQAVDVQCYFAYPHHPWERGSNENFNGLLRQYFPKRKSLARVRQADCDRATTKLNQRPRKRYGYETPIQRLQRSGVLHLEC
ncbi:IS30 family transposase [Cognatiluteimonas profundi]|uniref:IS30 family transposase n=1 Tax=Cognatiluteimonas profundi TaxID=2594501 RepID=UPI00131E0844|nr:IS30 family transposase [Lysobacter profundi]